LSSNIAGILIYVPQYLYSLLFIEALGVQSRGMKDWPLRTFISLSFETHRYSGFMDKTNTGRLTFVVFSHLPHIPGHTRAGNGWDNDYRSVGHYCMVYLCTWSVKFYHQHVVQAYNAASIAMAIQVLRVNFSFVLGNKTTNNMFHVKKK